MKSWPDRLKELPTEHLERMIEAQKREIEIKVRDLHSLEKVLEEKSRNRQCN